MQVTLHRNNNTTTSLGKMKFALLLFVSVIYVAHSAVLDVLPVQPEALENPPQPSNAEEPATETTEAAGPTAATGGDLEPAASYWGGGWGGGWRGRWGGGWGWGYRRPYWGGWGYRPWGPWGWY